MEIDRAKLILYHRGAFEVMAQSELVRQSDATVRLDRVLPNESARAADKGLRGRHRFHPQGIRLDSFSVAIYVMEIDCSTCMNMSTSRCCSTWNAPIGTPNCLRCFT